MTKTIYNYGVKDDGVPCHSEVVVTTVHGYGDDRTFELDGERVFILSVTDANGFFKEGWQQDAGVPYEGSDAEDLKALPDVSEGVEQFPGMFTLTDSLKSLGLFRKDGEIFMEQIPADIADIPVADGVTILDSKEKWEKELEKYNKGNQGQGNNP